MYEFGIVIFPDDVIELMKIHNPGCMPLDARVRSFSVDARDSYILVEFETEEDLGRGDIPVGAENDRLRVN